MVKILTPDEGVNLLKSLGVSVRRNQFLNKYFKNGFVNLTEYEAKDDFYFQGTYKEEPVHDRIVIYKVLPDPNWDKRPQDEYFKWKRTYHTREVNFISIFYDESNKPVLQKKVVYDPKQSEFKKQTPAARIDVVSDFKLLTEFDTSGDIAFDKLSVANKLFVDNLIPETGRPAIDYAIRRVLDLKNNTKKSKSKE